MSATAVAAPVIPAELAGEYRNLAGGFATPDQAAEFLKVSRAKIYAEMAAGRLKSVTVGRRGRRIRWRDLLAYANGEQVEAVASPA